MTSILQKVPRMGVSKEFVDSYLDIYGQTLNNGFKSVQTLVGNIDIKDIMQSRRFLEIHPELYTCFHGNVTYNLAGSAKGSADVDFNRKLSSVKSGILRELDVSTAIGNELILHIGNFPDKNKGMSLISNTLNELLILENVDTVSFSRRTEVPLIDFKSKRKIVLENSAGLGNSIGKSLEEISIVLSLINPNLRNNVNVCIDTCHISDAGEYDLGKITEVDRFYSDFSQIIGLPRLHLFHLNDSKFVFGSRRDRHEHLGDGHIFKDKEGLLSLQKFIKLSTDLEIPMVGEYSNGEKDIALVNSLASQKYQ